ncbi:hypothetical protein [Brevibacterium linens]|uniref:Uncharacterized protein n=2 Tax=Brevibacterium linens TaxID=1703 RepID=A0A2H1K0T7_BRELN|nr:hypothetical protein [Brevibacterium linens]SMX92956.1 hypothetical protein BLIN9172_02670 [Brevibacterium linens ATCC 9172]SMX93336.1 hypothetical protein BLIN101_02875 [Brevibacterium linens]
MTLTDVCTVRADSVTENPANTAGNSSVNGTAASARESTVTAVGA